MKYALALLVILMQAVGLHPLSAQTSYATLKQLNNYKNIVVVAKPELPKYGDTVHRRILNVLKSHNFPEPLDASILYSTTFDLSSIITLEYSITNPSNSAGEIQVTCKFVSSDNSVISSNTVKDKYPFLNEKNFIKSIDKCFSYLGAFNYSYGGSAPSQQVAENGTDRASTGTRDVELHAVKVDMNNLGKYYALVIGISEYNDPLIADLDSMPVKDAQRVASTLKTYYTFEDEDVKTLVDPTRRDIVIALDELSKKVGPNDNVLIFYAGHGHYEKEFGTGYWFPKDAEVNNSSNWLYNDQLVASIKKIKSLHTLLISDACFSGSIFKTRSIDMSQANALVKKKYALPSRKAITSGTLKTVPNESVFIKYLVNFLKNNKEPFLTGSQLFQSLEEPVGNNAPSVPQFGVIQNVGDEGGDFVFVRRVGK